MILEFLDFIGLTAFFEKLQLLFATKQAVAQVEEDTNQYVTEVDYSLLAPNTGAYIFCDNVTMTLEDFGFGGLTWSDLIHCEIDPALFDELHLSYDILIDGVVETVTTAENNKMVWRNSDDTVMLIISDVAAYVVNQNVADNATYLLEIYKTKESA